MKWLESIVAAPGEHAEVALRHSVITTGEPKDWCRALRSLPEIDLYFEPAYHRAYEMNGDGEALAFVAQDDGQILFHPFIIRQIDFVASASVAQPWYDLESVYGYTGPLSTTTDRAFLDEAWAGFYEWCVDRRVVAEFIRFSPWLQSHHFVDSKCKVELNRDTVVVNLSCSEEQLWSGYRSVVQRNIRKALKNGLVCEDLELDKGLELFRRLYESTMERVGADDYYSFGDSYFDFLVQSLGDRIKLFAVWKENEVIAAALFLLHSDRIHYHLAGSDACARRLAPNNLLLHTVARWGLERGFRYLHLGGGQSRPDDDSLLRFKAGFSRDRIPFFTGKRVMNREIYEELCGQWMLEKGVDKPQDRFLLYRL